MENNSTLPIIQLKNVFKSYFLGKEEIPVLKDINLTIYKNEYVALMGPSGSGKSTLMHILGCLDKPTKGKYFLNNIDVSMMNDNERAHIRNKFIGFIFQTFHLLPRSTALENVEMPLIYAGYPKKIRLEKAIKALENVGLKNRMHHKPNELSGGQRQRVAIARALVNQPSLLLADEPTGNLDSQTSTEIMNLLEEIYQQGNTILLVTHEEDIAKYARRIIRLKDGKIYSDTSSSTNTLLTYTHSAPKP